MERDCCKFICDAPMTSKGYGIEYNRIVSYLFNSVKVTMLPPVGERAGNWAYHL